MREVTERPEAIEAGCARLVGTDIRKIVSEVTTLIKDRKMYNTMAKSANPYGDGKAAQRIKKILSHELKDRV